MRRRSIDKIVPLATSGDLGAEEAALVAEGKLRLADQPLSPSLFRGAAPRVKRIHLLKALDAERED